MPPEEPVPVSDETVPPVSEEPVREASNACGRKEEVEVVDGAC